jgi:protein disulfide-isomerase
MKKRVSLLFGILSLLTVSPLFASKAGWLEDFAKAKSEAATKKKHIFLDFTGSDWCSWCIKMDKDVFSKAEFKDFAKEQLVLLDVDFPNSSPLPPAVKAQNDKLKQTYGIQGFPTLVLLDPSGKEVKRWVGYEAELVAKLRAAIGAK